MSLSGTTAKATDLVGLRTIVRAANWTELPEALSSRAVFGAYPLASENHSYGGPTLSWLYNDSFSSSYPFAWSGSEGRGLVVSHGTFGYSGSPCIVGDSFASLRQKGAFPAITAPVIWPSVVVLHLSADGFFYAGCAGYEDVGPGKVYKSTDGVVWTADLEPSSTQEVYQVFDFGSMPFAFAKSSSSAKAWTKASGAWVLDGTLTSSGAIQSVCVVGATIYGFSASKVWTGDGAGSWSSANWYAVGTRTATYGALLSGLIYTACKSSTTSAVVRYNPGTGATDTVYEFPVNPTMYGMCASDSWLYCSVGFSGPLHRLLRSSDGTTWDTVLESETDAFRKVKWINNRIVCSSDNGFYVGREL